MLILVRHGRTATNAAGALLGRDDPPLDDVGEAQAAAVGALLAGRPPARVVSSPLTRCRATAEAVAAACGVDRVDVDERWVEMAYGELEGVPLADVDTATWARWRADPTWAPPGGESLAAVGARVRRACQQLARAAAIADVVVVSHVSPIKAVATWALGTGDLGAWRLYLGPGSVARVRIGPRGPSLVSWNETAHLP